MNRSELKNFYFSIRKTSEEICRPLQTEDYVVQPIDDVSPPKWHLGHTTWFFETVLLQKFLPHYKPFHQLYNFVFNSYYESFGTRVARPKRGSLSRPTVKEIYAYRAAVDEQMHGLFESIDATQWPEFSRLVILGLHHEQQHQELLIYDIKYIFASNPLRPVYQKARPRTTQNIPDSAFIEFAGGIVEIGHAGDGFAWDNEMPAHRVLLDDYKLQNRLVTNGEYLQFINDGGYNDFRHWLSDGWFAVQQQGWQSPLYWEKIDGQWFIMTLSGWGELDPHEPVCHVSFYEADAFAKWAQKRLPTEAEWEHAARTVKANAAEGNFLDDQYFHPIPCRTTGSNGLHQMLGDVWVWTASAYLGYPGYRQEAGALGEYNGKFMSNQMVLRGGSCATPRNHIRLTYRNFFQSDKRWPFTGIRLADD
ncbi:MAG: ergothioneine biosynthesis protein EgtB [candidate division KSB1 bacterium]|nr:ergothioneine biosynthesis protein EgtB [candidate division KSB1 bacterium]MDZ7365216.1 ergothioneine biosynthesis protein EgtB [candidate division KSB1 bacterium]MDZ7407271.1 ergothioneine biosynthesis protein EgtB [candidate division KSB1 bacterium]